MNIWDQLVDCICRPPRDVYKPAELLGGSNQTFMIGAMECTRLDYELVGRQGMKLQCSHYFPLDAKSQDDKLPVVVYCHCNSGSRRDAEEAIYHLLPCGVGVVAFDFTGSGLSDGKWVTLGAHEVEDLAVVVKHLRSQGGISSIGLWGRSMGAVTALLYSHLDPDIAGMVLDSPFSRLTDLMLEIVVSQRLPIPKVMLKLALRLMRNSVKRKAGCDINTVSPLDVVPRSAIPAMFGHGEEDSFINIQHSVKLYEAYNSTADAPVYKNLVRFKGDHNHPRPAFFYSSVCCFFHQQLKLDQVLLGGNPADTQQLMKYGSLALSSAYADHLDRANGFINTPWSLEPVSGLSPEDQAAAAAAAALLADEPAGLNGSASNGSGRGGGSGSSAHAGHSSSTAGGPAGISSLGGLTSLPRIAVPAAHITEGGLNSPRRPDARQTLLPGDTCASSSGGGRHAGRAPGMGRSPQDASNAQQLLCLSGAGSPISPLRHYQQQQQQQQHRERRQHHQQQQQQSLSPRPAAAVSVPGVRPASTATGEELFAVGSRGAPGAVLAAHETLEGSRNGAGAAAQGLGDSRGSSGSFGAAGEQFSKWFKRSSTSGSTPSTSPPVAASEGGGMLRPRSSGSGQARGGRQEQGAGAAAARSAGGVAMQTSPLAAAVVHRHPPQQQQQQQQQQQALPPHDTQGLQHSGTTPASGSRSAGAAAVGPGVLQGGGGADGGAVPGSLDEEEQMLQAAIALSLAESTQQEQQRPTAAVAAP